MPRGIDKSILKPILKRLGGMEFMISSVHVAYLESICPADWLLIG
jgi:hypothetical protein